MSDMHDPYKDQLAAAAYVGSGAPEALRRPVLSSYISITSPRAVRSP